MGFVVQWVKPLLEMPTSNTGQLFYFWIELPANASWSTWSLTSSKETQLKIWLHTFILAQPWLLPAFWLWSSTWKISLPVALPFKKIKILNSNYFYLIKETVDNLFIKIYYPNTFQLNHLSETLKTALLYISPVTYF